MKRGYIVFLMSCRPIKTITSKQLIKLISYTHDGGLDTRIVVQAYTAA